MSLEMDQSIPNERKVYFTKMIQFLLLKAR